jgi:hypothetical protein
MTRMTGDLLVVGSVPLASAEEVFGTLAGELGSFLDAYPDGETGDRSFWTFYLPTRTYSGHSDLIDVNRPEGGQVRQPERGASSEEWNRSWWTLRLREGVTSLTFDDLHYAEVATESYAVFRRLREAGAIPGHARFQVSLPTTGSAVMPFFARPEDWPVIYDAYRRAIRAEVAKIAEGIPPEDLVIQWDIATEVRDLLAGDRPLLPWSPETSLDEKWQRHLHDMTQLSSAIPKETLLGYHFCFGTWGGWPQSHASDISLCVRLANEAFSRAGRRVDYVHMPALPDASERFFEPLADLAIGDARPYLGIVLDDGLEGFERRARAARRHLAEFGIASYCGWGREDPATLPRILANLRASAERLPEIRAAAPMKA